MIFEKVFMNESPWEAGARQSEVECHQKTHGCSQTWWPMMVEYAEARSSHWSVIYVYRRVASWKANAPRLVTFDVYTFPIHGIKDPPECRGNGEVTWANDKAIYCIASWEKKWHFVEKDVKIKIIMSEKGEMYRL